MQAQAFEVVAETLHEVAPETLHDVMAGQQADSMRLWLVYLDGWFRV